MLQHLIAVTMIILNRMMIILNRIFKKLSEIKGDSIELELRKYPELQKVYAICNSSPHGKWIIGKNDAINLYKLVLKIKPSKVVEFGTGIGASTAVLALALKNVGKGEIVSIEQSPKCAKIARELMEPTLEKWVTIITAKPIIFRVEKISRWKYFSGYEWTPSNNDFFDFVVIDGPGGWLQDGELVSLENGDIIRLLPHLVKGCKVYIDGRRPTVEMIKRYLWKYFVVLEDNIQFTLLEKNERCVKSIDDLQIADKKLEQYQYDDYFNYNIVINTNE